MFCKHPKIDSENFEYVDISALEPEGFDEIKDDIISGKNITYKVISNAYKLICLHKYLSI